MNAREAARAMSEIIEQHVHDRVAPAPAAYESSGEVVRWRDAAAIFETPPALVYETDGYGHIVGGGSLVPAGEGVTFTPPHCAPHTSRRGEWIAITPMRPPPYAVPIIVRAVLSGVPISIPVMADKLGRYRHINRGPLDPGAYLETHCYRVTHWQHYPDPFIPATRYRVMCRQYWHAEDGLFPGEVAYLALPDARGLTFQDAQTVLAECRAKQAERMANVPCFISIFRHCEFVIEPEGEQGRAP